MAVLRYRNPSAQSAIAGPVTSRPSMGAASRAPISAPSSPWAWNHSPANGRLTPLAPNSSTYWSPIRQADPGAGAGRDSVAEFMRSDSRRNRACGLA